jgi:hypothetical protein
LLDHLRGTVDAPTRNAPHASTADKVEEQAGQNPSVFVEIDLLRPTRGRVGKFPVTVRRRTSSEIKLRNCCKYARSEPARRVSRQPAVTSKPYEEFYSFAPEPAAA